MVCDLRITPYSYNENGDTRFTIFFYQGLSPIQSSDLQGSNQCIMFQEIRLFFNFQDVNFFT